MPVPKSNGEYEHRTGLPLILGNDPKVLILGSIPSEQSALKEEYYGNPRNQFWRIMYAIFNGTPDSKYETRLAFLRDKHIALWDVLNGCDIIDSKDSTIKNEVLNDLEGLFKANSGISHVFLNGQKAHKHYEKMVEGRCSEDAVKPMAIILPSSSPARAIDYWKKVEAWSAIRWVLNKSGPDGDR